MTRDSAITSSMNPITTTSELAAVCRRMASYPFITVDTEFLRETTYYQLLKSSSRSYRFSRNTNHG